MMDHNLFKQARESLNKEAFNPMTPEAQAAAAQQGAAPPPPGAAPPMDPAMMGGAPPMDPAMMGGAPPMDPAMMGMDPAMAAGMPMDPAMMDPAMMDPAMMDPAMMDPAAAGTPVTLNLEDLQQVIKELGASGGESSEDGGESKRATNREIMDAVSTLQEQMAALASAMGIQLPAGDVGSGAGTELEAPANPDDIAAAAEQLSGGAMMEDPMSQAMAMGLPPGEMPPGAMPKMAVDKWRNTKAGQLADKTT
jgi:hypothetical protein